jgi:hypothetical protein
MPLSCFDVAEVEVKFISMRAAYQRFDPTEHKALCPFCFFYNKNSTCFGHACNTGIHIHEPTLIERRLKGEL